MSPFRRLLDDLGEASPKRLDDLGEVSPKRLDDLGEVSPKRLDDLGEVSPKQLDDLGEVSPKPPRGDGLGDARYDRRRTSEEGRLGTRRGRYGCPAAGPRAPECR